VQKGINVEQLTYVGMGDFVGSGNQLGNVLEGGNGNDTLDGGLGADKMSGGFGDDSYVVDRPGDVVSEAAGAGIDTVRSSVGYTLGANVEHLILLGSGNINATGNALDNRLTGDAGNNVLLGGVGADTLDGGPGNDILRGGAGDDTFVFDAADTKIVAGDAGTDTLRFDFSRQSLDLAGKAGSVYTGLECIDLGGTGDNGLSFRAVDVVKLSGTTNDLFIRGNAGDSVSSTGQGWVAGGDQTIGGVLYHSYTSGEAHLHVQAGIDAVLS
jgi:Ca2+-binding RTX toxin-like protein